MEQTLETKSLRRKTIEMKQKLWQMVNVVWYCMD